MRRLTDEARKKIQSDAFYRKCCLCGRGKPIQIHHHLIFAGRQCDEWWSLLPLCPPCHGQADRKEVRAKLDVIMLARAGDEINKFSKIKPR
jgi:hypothetical protein